MKIAIDLSPLQGPHRMRGIGYTVMHFINNISQEDKDGNEYLFYTLPISQQKYDPFELLDLQGFNFHTKELKKGWRLSRDLPGKLRHISNLFNEVLKFAEYCLGDPRVGRLKGVDVFLQCDQSQALPKKRRRTKVALILYDIIPYVLEWDYLWNYKTAKVRGYSWKGALICAVRRYSYKRKLHINIKRANLMIAISESTAKDFSNNFRFKRSKLKVVHLGIPEQPEYSSKQTDLIKYRHTSWGCFAQKASSDEFKKPFLLFVGGADRRRRLEDLVGAFNILRARGHDIRLVLVGDSMQGPDTVSSIEAQKAIMNSSYLEDIVFMGFASDEDREWLYKHALAFVFPSMYEGFGLPVLEAMQYGTPIISYKNAATLEVAGDLPVYVDSATEMSNALECLLVKPISMGDKKQLINQAQKYSWGKTSKAILEACNIFK